MLRVLESIFIVFGMIEVFLIIMCLWGSKWRTEMITKRGIELIKTTWIIVAVLHYLQR